MTSLDIQIIILSVLANFFLKWKTILNATFFRLPYTGFLSKYWFSDFVLQVYTSQTSQLTFSIGYIRNFVESKMLLCLTQKRSGKRGKDWNTAWGKFTEFEIYLNEEFASATIIHKISGTNSDKTWNSKLWWNFNLCFSNLSF